MLNLKKNDSMQQEINKTLQILKEQLETYFEEVGLGKIVILEDVTTTGGSSIKAVQRIHEATDCEVIAVISIVDREEGAVEAFSAAGIHFESIMTRSDVAGQ